MVKHDQSDGWYGYSWLEMPAEGTREYQKLEHRGGFDVPAWDGHRPEVDRLDGWSTDAIQAEREQTIAVRTAGAVPRYRGRS